MNAHTTAEHVNAGAEAYRQMDAFDRELLRKVLDETVAQARCDKSDADTEIAATEARMKELAKAYNEEKRANAAAIEKWRAAHVSELRAEQRLSSILEGDSR